eukprot:scaffold10538_cov66-Phaeocystis_antarctica.AAC.2
MSTSLILHIKQFGFKHGKALLMADSWRGPYRLVASDSNARWRGSTANAEGSWHQLVEGNRGLAANIVAASVRLGSGRVHEHTRRCGLSPCAGTPLLKR